MSSSSHKQKNKFYLKQWSNLSLGFDIIVRNYEGFVVAARSTTKSIFVKSIVVKALAALHAAELNWELWFQEIILDGVSIQIANVVNAIGTNWSKFGHIVGGIRIVLNKLRQ
jgi:hypothetical protein